MRWAKVLPQTVPHSYDYVIVKRLTANCVPRSVYAI